MDGRTDRQTDRHRQTDRRTDGWTDGQTDKQTDHRMDRRMDRRTNRQTTGWTDGQTDRQTDRQSCTQPYSQQTCVIGLSPSSERCSSVAQHTIVPLQDLSPNYCCSAGKWFDLMIDDITQRPVTASQHNNTISYVSQYIPLWVGIADLGSPQAEAVTQSFLHSSLIQPGGVATSTYNSTQQWDFPNCWAPLQASSGVCPTYSTSEMFLRPRELTGTFLWKE